MLKVSSPDSPAHQENVRGVVERIKERERAKKYKDRIPKPKLRKGFTAVPNELWDRKDVTRPMLLLYCYMLSWKSAANTFSRSQADMAAAMRCSERHIRRLLVRLERVELIYPVWRGDHPESNQASRYMLLVTADVRPARKPRTTRTPESGNQDMGVR